MTAPDLAVLLQYAAGPRLAARLASLSACGLSVVARPEEDDAAFRAALPEAEVIWHVLAPIDASIMAAAPRLKLVQKIGVGVNTIDLETAKQRGIAVCNMPGTNSQAVAEMTLMLMLAALRRLSFHDAATRAGRGWQRDPAVIEGLGEIAGRVVGLVGYGAVPRLLAPWLVAMGATVIFASRSEQKDAVGTRVPMSELLARADIISLHVPLTPETSGLIGPDAIAAMKPGTILVNTARGGLIDQGALTTALKAGYLGAAGLDVLADEPVAPDDPILALDNLVVAPHVAWLTMETIERSLVVAVDCRRLRAGEPLLHRVA